MSRVLSRGLSFAIRCGEVICGAVVLGVMAYNIHQSRDAAIRTISDRSIYAMCLAAASILLALIWLIPMGHTFIHWPIDFLVSCAWFAAFALLYVEFQNKPCDQNLAHGISGLTSGGTCNQRRASWAFSFLGGCFWVAGAFLGAWYTWRERKSKKTSRSSSA